MPFPSLYTICFDYIKQHTEDISSLRGVPFSVVQGIIEHIFTSDTPINSSILSVIAESHSKELREAQLTWSSLILSKAAIRSAVPPLTAISKHFPNFITCLKMGQSNLDDQDILLLRGFNNLKTLHLGGNPGITDRGILYLTSIATSPIPIGMPYLEELYLVDLPGVTDKSLKFITKFSAMNYIDISNTNITESVAVRYLSSGGFSRVIDRVAPFDIKSAFDIFANSKFYWFIKDIAFQYDQGQRSKSFANENNTNSIPTFHFIRSLSLNTPKKVEKSNVQTLQTRVKKRKLTANEFLDMFEKEIANDG